MTKAKTKTRGLVQPLDIEVGKRIKHYRWLAGLTQGELAKKAGVKFQQIQKYESGANRVAASRLASIAEVLDIPIESFFNAPAKPKGRQAKNPPPDSRESLEVLRAYYALPESLQTIMLDFIRALRKQGIKDRRRK